MLDRPLPAQLVGINRHQDHYSTELQTNHRELRDAYRKLAQVEYKLANRCTLGIQRKEKKKLQWAKAMMKRKVQELEDQSAGMRKQVFTPQSMMIETGPLTAMSLVSYPFTPSPYGMPATPLWPLQSPYWPVQGFWQLPAIHGGVPSWYRGQPDYPSFDRPVERHHSIEAEEAASDSTNYVSAHEDEGAAIVDPCRNIPEDVPVIVHGASRANEDRLETSASPHSPDRLKEAENIPSSGHKRRYSEAAIQLIEGRLTEPDNGNSTHRKRRSMYVRPSENVDVSGQ